MSWAEIKKAINNNISKPLNVLIGEKSAEIFAKLTSIQGDTLKCRNDIILEPYAERRYYNADISGASTEMQTIVSVSGKGQLLDAIIQSYSNYPQIAVFRISIDGVVYYYHDSTNIYGFYNAPGGVLQSEYLDSIATSNPRYRTQERVIYPAGTSGSNNIVDYIRYPDQAVHTDTRTLIISKNPIKFNSSLLIEACVVKKMTSITSVQVTYKLAS